MKKILFLCFLFLCTAVHAANLKLTDGRVIEADKIIIQNDEITVIKGEDTMTYFSEQVSAVDHLFSEEEAPAEAALEEVMDADEVIAEELPADKEIVPEEMMDSDKGSMLEEMKDSNTESILEETKDSDTESILEETKDSDTESILEKMMGADKGSMQEEMIDADKGSMQEEMIDVDEDSIQEEMIDVDEGSMQEEMMDADEGSMPEAINDAMMEEMKEPFEEQITNADDSVEVDTENEETQESVSPNHISPTLESLSDEEKEAIQTQYAAYNEAFVKATSFNDLKSFMDPGKYAEVEKAIAEGDRSEMELFGLVKMMSPTNPEIKEVVLEKGKAILKASAVGIMGKGKGKIEFTKHDDGWKIFNEDWAFGDTSVGGVKEEIMESIEKGDDWIKGTLHGEEIIFDNVVFNEAGRSIEFRIGEGFLPDASLTISFLEDQMPVDGTTITHEPQGQWGFKPQISLYWLEEGASKSQTYASDYTLELIFSEREGELISGTITLDHPETNSKVGGSFQAGIRTP